eukprot:COSAG02_NODE_10103_length_2023_cov_1.104470_2_plen_240_part_00
MSNLFGESLPVDGGKVEVYSASLATWIPATVTAVVDERDVVVQYAVDGAREGASGVRTKRVDVFDPALMRSIDTGRPFEWRAGGLLGPAGGAADAASMTAAARAPEPAPAPARNSPAPAPALAPGSGDMRYPQEGDTVEVYSKSLETWIPATVTAVVDDQDIVVHYAVAGAREGASGFRTKRVAVFDHTLLRSIQTGLHFEPPPNATAGDDADADAGFDALAADADAGFDSLASEATLS